MDEPRYQRPISDRDLLDRKKDVQRFTNIILGTRSPFTFSLEAPWGSGKSFFLGLLSKELKKNGVTCIGFNAWENDLTGSALGTIIGELLTQLQPEKNSAKDGKKRRNLSRIKEHTGTVAKIAGRTALMLGTGAVLPFQHTS